MRLVERPRAVQGLAPVSEPGCGEVRRAAGRRPRLQSRRRLGPESRNRSSTWTPSRTLHWSAGRGAPWPAETAATYCTFFLYGRLRAAEELCARS